MFDPNMMNAMSEMMKNPDMLKKMDEMMKNPEIMNNAMKMMNDPSMANLFGGNMPDLENKDEDEKNNNCCNDNNCSKENNKCETKFLVEDKVKLVNLNSDSYNGRDCVIKNYDNSTNRYNVFVISMNKTISVKEENLQNDDEVVIEIN